MLATPPFCTSVRRVLDGHFAMEIRPGRNILQTDSRMAKRDREHGRSRRQFTD
jgi:hypothetical protein